MQIAIVHSEAFRLFLFASYHTIYINLLSELPTTLSPHLMYTPVFLLLLPLRLFLIKTPLHVS
jgi:hypothetical protein